MPAEAYIRVGSFISVLVVMGIAETIWPKRDLTASKIQRWWSNLSIATLSSLLVRILFPILPTGLAVILAKNGWGVLNMIALPNWMAILVSVIFLDMVIYWQHVVFHRVNILWRIHRMHHIDTDIDASTGVRFHPLEIMLSALIKLAVISIIGPPVIAVIAFEIILNGCALFNHANVSLPSKTDNLLRLLVVTPDMHRVHHSTDLLEANTNFGFNLPWWDRIFGTYKAQPDKGHEGMTIGLNIFRDKKYLRLREMLAIPFR